MKDKVCMITGATSGIGKMTAFKLAEKGAQIALVARDSQKAEMVRQEIVNVTGNEKITVLIANFRSLKTIQLMVDEFHTKFTILHVLVNNAGTSQSKRTETKDGLETTFGVNHVAPFYLTQLLLPTLKQSAPARIINVSSALHSSATIKLEDLQTEKSKYRSLRVYGESKLANVLFTYELHNRLRAEGINDISVNAVHPGFVRTNLGRDGGGFFRKYIFHYVIRPLVAISPTKGAETSVYLASSPEVEGISGKYFVKKKAVPSSEMSYDRKLQQDLWIATEKIIESIT